MRKATGWSLLASFALCGCRIFVEPSPELLSRVRGANPTPPPHVRAKVRVHLKSPWIEGQFDGVLLARTGLAPRVRLQAFPDLGGKVLDVLARPDRVIGYLPQSNEGGDHALPLDGIPTALDCLGISLLEHFAPLGDDRVLGMKEYADGWSIRLRPVVEEIEMTAWLDNDGLPRSRKFKWSFFVQWEQLVEPDRGFTIEAGGVLIRLEVLDVHAVESVPDPVFELRLPPGIKALGK